MRNKTVIFAFFLCTLFFFDQVTKSWARGLEVSRPKDETILAIYPTVNERGLLGLFPAFPELIATLLAIVSVYIIARNYRQELTPLALIAFALFLAGIFGNTLDRLLFDQVTDWLFVYPGVVLNFADIFILLGSISILFFIVARQRNST